MKDRHIPSTHQDGSYSRS